MDPGFFGRGGTYGPYQHIGTVPIISLSQKNHCQNNPNGTVALKGPHEDDGPISTQLTPQLYFTFD